MSSSITSYLNKVLEENSFFYEEKRYKIKVKQIIDKLNKLYGNDIHEIIYSGSWVKGTCVSQKFDMDLVVVFKKDSFSSLEKMYEDVYNNIDYYFNNKAKIRRQKVSIGLEFSLYNKNYILNIDIVPAREIEQNDYLRTGDLNLFKRQTYFLGLFGKNTHIKTNIHKQIESVNNKNVKNIIKILKIFKISQNRNYKSFLLEQLVVAAHKQTAFNVNLLSNLKKLLKFIVVYIDKIKLKDPGNSNNIITDSLFNDDRELLLEDAEMFLNIIESQNIELLKKKIPLLLE